MYFSYIFTNEACCHRLIERSMCFKLWCKSRSILSVLEGARRIFSKKFSIEFTTFHDHQCSRRGSLLRWGPAQILQIFIRKGSGFYWYICDNLSLCTFAERQAMKPWGWLWWKIINLCHRFSIDTQNRISKMVAVNFQVCFQIFFNFSYNYSHNNTWNSLPREDTYRYS